MLSESVLKIDVCQYLEENYPLDDEDLERMHKLYRLVAYRRCSRWVFQIWGKRIEDRFLLVFTPKLGSASRPLMAFIHILNMPRDRNSNFLRLYNIIPLVIVIKYCPYDK